MFRNVAIILIIACLFILALPNCLDASRAARDWWRKLNAPKEPPPQPSEDDPPPPPPPSKEG